MKTINLHVHTNLSDGKYSPMEVVKMTNEEKEFHYVCLFPDDSVDLSDFRKLIARNVNPDSRPRITAILKRLREEAQIDLGPYERLADIYGERIRLPHLAEQMYLQGYTSSVAEGLDIYIGERGEKRCYVPKNQKFISLDELLPVLKAAKGIPILAHLKAYQLSEEQEEDFLYQFRKAAGPIGFLETDYAKYDLKTRILLYILACRFDLGESAGSDFHGFIAEDVLSPYHPYLIYERMIERWRKYYIS